MGKEERRKQLEARLDETVREWYLAKDTDPDKALRLKTEILSLAFGSDAFDDGTELFIEAFLKTLERYLPGKGPFSHYFSTTYSARKKDSTSPKSPVSLNGPLPGGDEGAEATFMDLAAEPGCDPAARLETLSPLEELTAQIINFTALHPGQAGNETRRNWFRLFFTEDITLAAKEAPACLPHERDVFRALKESYLDYYMSAPCRTMARLSTTRLKPYGDVVPERREERRETPVPLPAKVSLAYLARVERLTKGVGDSSRSTYLGYYEALKRQILRTEAPQ